jgi:hypothetical protein
MIPTKLPKPNDHGNYFLHDDKSVSGPVVFVGGTQPQVHDGPSPGGKKRWFASLGNLIEGPGVLTDRDGIRYFDNPKDALEALREAASESA